MLKILIADEDGICTPELVPFKMYGEINTSYIALFLKSPYVDSEINKVTYGVKMPRVGTKTMVNFYVPLPPIEEQQRIVDRVDELMSKVDEYEKLENQLVQLKEQFPKDMRDSLLQTGMMGRLTNQLTSDTSVETTLESIELEKQQLIKNKKMKNDKHFSEINEDEALYDIPNSWSWKRLKDVTYNHGQKAPEKKFCYIDVSSINNKQHCLNEQETLVEPFNASSRARKIVTEGDVIFATIRPYLENVCIINKHFTHQPIVSTAFAVMHCLNGLNNKYLYYYLLSPKFMAFVNSSDNSKGVAYPAISEGKFFNGLISFPPIEEQQRIVDKLDEMLPLVDALAQMD